MPKTIIAIALTILLIVCCTLCNSTNVKSEEVKAEEIVNYVTLYSPEEKTISVPEYEVEAYKKVGWYNEPVMYIWHLNEYQITIPKKDLQTYLNSGYWFLQKPSVNYDDMLLLARVIYAEATENPNLRVKDRQYVGSVVINRLKSGYWGNKLTNVIYAPRQYACVGNRKFNSYPPQECIDIAKQLLLGVSFGVPENVIFQAQFRQGSGIWQIVGVHYYCYK